jgi:hypothetical protein
VIHSSALSPTVVAAIRLVLLALLVLLFVGAVIALFSSTTGIVEKVVLAAVAVLVALAVPRVQGLRGAPPH